MHRILRRIINSWRAPQPLPPPAPPPPPPQPDYPGQALLADNRRRDFIDLCVPLYEASMKGDWNAAQVLIGNREYLLRCSITHNYETALHVAASGQSNPESINYVENLVRLMNREDLQLQNKNGNTALSLAAAAGNVEIARIMLRKNGDLPIIPNKENMMPLYIAALCGNEDMVKYLYKDFQGMRGPGWTTTTMSWVLVKCIECDMFDVVLDILEDHPELPQHSQRTLALKALARKSSAFNGIEPTKCKVVRILGLIWENFEGERKAVIDDILRGHPDENGLHPNGILFIAAEMGNTNFLVELIRKYPDIIWKKNDNHQSIFHVAVSYRHVNIYKLLYEIGSLKTLIFPLKDQDGNNMLHLVGKKSMRSRLDQDVSGAAFELQRELLWFKEVESMIHPDYKDRKNNQGQTPYELFTKDHKDLVVDGEKWMKDTASQCMVVAALIATVVFAVAYTIPGGYRQTDDKEKGYKEGLPVFLYNGPFLAFVVLDAFSLIMSSTSILVFLSMLTSRYTQEDFRKSLPKKLLAGLLMLFLSIVTMMISFSVSFFVLYSSHRFIALAISIALVSVIPIFFHGLLQYPLLKDVYRSTFHSGRLFKPKKQMLYYQNPNF
ncbi:ankyrin repeat-containing protein NPR4 [Lactuca sativa]|uniref:ankyrin repeat-containing protein NPR4 n=1 Tax=Lactuca sativa TaxID=4236 RepID=UPI001C68DEB5|nr:ankyrin repeat-containing protein NPR4 [Lactuca sativa]